MGPVTVVKVGVDGVPIRERHDTRDQLEIGVAVAGGDGVEAGGVAFFQDLDHEVSDKQFPPLDEHGDNHRHQQLVHGGQQGKVTAQVLMMT